MRSGFRTELTARPADSLPLALRWTSGAHQPNPKPNCCSWLGGMAENGQNLLALLARTNCWPRLSWSPAAGERSVAGQSARRPVRPVRPLCVGVVGGCLLRRWRWRRRWRRRHRRRHQSDHHFLPVSSGQPAAAPLTQFMLQEEELDGAIVARPAHTVGALTVPGGQRGWRCHRGQCRAGRLYLSAAFAAVDPQRFSQTGGGSRASRRLTGQPPSMPSGRPAAGLPSYPAGSTVAPLTLAPQPARPK